MNCHPIKSTSKMPSSMTRLVEANSKAMLAVKSAPFRNRDRAIATAAYEHEDEAPPKPHAFSKVIARASGKSFRISPLDTTDCTIAEKPNPIISAHRISQNMANDMFKACNTEVR